MILLKGDCYKEIKPNSVYLATCNSVIGANGTLVMGKGNAKALLKTFNDRADLRLADYINNGEEYNLRIIQYRPKENIYYGAFQSKHHFKDKSDIGLIERSILKLKEAANQRKDLIFHLPFPGIGLGGLKYEDVIKILLQLPDNVYVWTKG